MDDCIRHLVAAGGVGRTTAGKVAGPIPQFRILEGGAASTLRACAPRALQLQSCSATSTASSSQSLGTSGQG